MKSLGHIYAGLPILAFYPFIGDSAIVMFISSILIDLDHVGLVFTEKAFSIKKILKIQKNLYKNYIEDKVNSYKKSIYLFHTIEFLTIFFILSLKFKSLFFVCLGFIYHFIFDLIHHIKIKMPVGRLMSLTYHFHFLKTQNSSSIIKSALPSKNIIESKE